MRGRRPTLLVSWAAARAWRGDLSQRVTAPVVTVRGRMSSRYTAADVGVENGWDGGNLVVIGVTLDRTDFNRAHTY